ncbi:MAG TPA: UDP-glucose/GDP-mannose dehydrogenase family protein [Acidimicrobiales bacterium]|nr:UDP-glucose/GDP-mannose dehydrogenase family protein [Acidimicrobiales bacterium]
MRDTGTSGAFGTPGGRNRDSDPGGPGAYFGHRGAAVRVLPNAHGRVIAVIGMGYVGIPTAATLAHLGHRVTCADSDADKIALLAGGTVPIVEADLQDLVREGQAAGRLRFMVGAGEAVTDAEFVFLCLPTPEGADGSVDLSYVESVATEIAPHLTANTIIVNKSTVPVGSTLVVERVLGRRDITVVSNPEFLREGTAVTDSLHPERIVVGAADQAAAAKVGKLFAGTHAPLLITDAATAETIKYASNAFLATKLSFVNAVAGLCEAVGADVRDVILGLGYDKRIGFEFLRPGPGWGGSCLPKDTRALVHIAEQAGYDFSFLQGAIATNEEQFARVVDKVKQAVVRAAATSSEVTASGDNLAGSVIAVWGLTFKAGTDDLRNSPAVEIVKRLVAEGATVQAFDPTVVVPEGQFSSRVAELSHTDTLGSVATLDDSVRAFPDAYAACEGASAVVVLTEWDEFRWLDFSQVLKRLVAPVVVDARNLLDPAQMRRLGFDYTGIGRR